MKFLKIVGLVLFFHVSLLSVLFFQPGCQTMETCQTDGSVRATDFVACPSDDARFTEESRFVPVEETPTSKNTRFKPTRPVQGSFDDKPVSSKNELLKSFDSFGENSPQAVGATYTVKSGDSLWLLAKRNGVSVADLAIVNGINRDTVLKVGQKLIIPSNKTSTATTEKFAEGSSYTIVKGDTLSEIAARFHVSIESLKNANNMKDNVIYAGKKIVIPGVTQKTVDSVPVKNKNVSENFLNSEDSYQVKNGDTLSVIAVRFGTTVGDLMKWNNMADAGKLRAGQTLVVRDRSAKTSVSPVVILPTVDKMTELDAFIVESAEEPLEEYNEFELFEDDMLFASEEIPVVITTEE